MGQQVVDRELVLLPKVAHDAREIAGTESATLEIDDALEYVECDPDRLQRVLENLFRNAVDHCCENASVRVGRLEGTTGFYVADDGPGIPPETRDEVFDYGFTSSDDGTDFGLAIVREIADAHGWGVTVGESESGGARFEFEGPSVVESP